MKECYVIYLWGGDVYGNITLLKVITDVSKIDDEIIAIANERNLEVVSYEMEWCYRYYKHISDERDIAIIVERTTLE